MARGCHRKLRGRRPGRWKALALAAAMWRSTTSARRSAQLPDVPTVFESGFPGVGAGIWLAMFAKGATPSGVVARLHEPMMRALSSAAIRGRMTQNGVDTRHSPPHELAVFARAELACWAKAVKTSGTTVD